MSELIFRRAGEDLMRVSLDRPRVSVGRGGHNDVAIPDDGVSRSQFSIVQRGTRTVLVDDSGRGTRVAGVAAQEAELEDGAEIDLGAWSALFREGGSVAEAATDPRLGLRQGQTVPQPSAARVAGELRVRAQRGGCPEQTTTWARAELTVGAGPHNRLVLGDRFVSSSHLVLSRTPRGIWLRDLGSTNGTFLNGARAREVEVPLGAVVRLGETELRLELASEVAIETPIRGLIGRDPALLRVLQHIDRVAPTAASVTVFGETGTGKELIARCIHDRSPRRDQPFVPVNCAALHRELVESELFGHEKGAFTGADRSRPGAFELASGGTLFLDEIGELTLDLQAKLLRVLETGEVRRLGATAPVSCDVRVVAATHVDLFCEVQRGRFREDLFYRLCVFPLHLPPLRQRPGDLLALASHFLALLEAGQPVHLTPSAQAKLAAHPFRGNVRELRNVMQRALCLRSGSAILPEHIVFDGSYRATAGSVDPRRDDEDYLYLPDRTMEECENAIVARAILRHADKTAAADELAMSRTTVIKICKRTERRRRATGEEPSLRSGPAAR